VAVPCLGLRPEIYCEACYVRVTSANTSTLRSNHSRIRTHWILRISCPFRYDYFIHSRASPRRAESRPRDCQNQE